VRRALLFLLAVVVALVLFGPALVQRPPVVERVPTVLDDGADAPPRRVELNAFRGCFGILRPGIRRERPGCERIRERRGGVETRLGAVEIPSG
jgi:hypothetical protein